MPLPGVPYVGKVTADSHAPIIVLFCLRLDNVTTMLLMAPMTMSVFKSVGRDPVPLLMAQVKDYLFG